MTPTTSTLTGVGSDRHLHDWANQEIHSALRAHPEQADALRRSGCLLWPTGDSMRSELVYRAHCREILNRVAAGIDTRLATAAEICAHLPADTPTPLQRETAGLYARMWALAFLPQDSPVREYEAVFGPVIDDLEHRARHHYSQPSRHSSLAHPDHECDHADRDPVTRAA